MAFLMGHSKSAPFPSGRYTHTNPLRREGGLRLLTEPLPEPLRWAIIRAWRRPAHYEGNEAIQSIHRQRPDDAHLAWSTPRGILLLTFTEMEVSRRGVEAPQASILPATRKQAAAGPGNVSAAALRGAGAADWRSQRPGRVPAPDSSSQLAGAGQVRLEWRHFRRTQPDAARNSRSRSLLGSRGKA